MSSYWEKWITAAPSHPTGRPLALMAPAEGVSAEEVAAARSFLGSVFAAVENPVLTSLPADERAAVATVSSALSSGTPTLQPCFDVEIRETPGKGRGLFARTPFKPGDTIFIEYPHVFRFQELSALVPDAIEGECMSLLESFNARLAASWGAEPPECNALLPRIRRTLPAPAPVADVPVRTAAALCDHCLGPLLTAAGARMHTALANEAWGLRDGIAGTAAPAPETAAKASSSSSDDDKDDEEEEQEAPPVSPQKWSSYLPPLPLPAAGRAPGPVVTATHLARTAKPAVPGGSVTSAGVPVAGPTALVSLPAAVAAGLPDAAADTLFTPYAFSAHGGPLPVQLSIPHTSATAESTVASAAAAGEVAPTCVHHAVAAFHLPGPLFCSSGCRDAAVDSHLNLLCAAPLPVPAVAPGNSGSALASYPAVSPESAAALANLTSFLASEQWISGARIARLVASIVNGLRARVGSRGGGAAAERQWWLQVTDDDWCAVLAPLDSFERSVYSDKDDTSSAPEPAARADDDEGNDGMGSSPAELLRTIHVHLCALIDALWPVESAAADAEAGPEADSPAVSTAVQAPASSTVLPLLLLDTLAGILTHNTQHIEVATSAEIEAQHARAAVATGRGGSSPAAALDSGTVSASPYETPLPAGLVSGMFPWHAHLNHACRPNAFITGGGPLFTPPASAGVPGGRAQAQVCALHARALPRALAACVVVHCQRPIAPGEEITISYADELTSNADPRAPAVPSIADPLEAARALLRASKGKESKMEAELARVIHERFGWTCRCALCLARELVAAATPAAAAPAKNSKGTAGRR
jgi:hypothetical protein